MILQLNPYIPVFAKKHGYGEALLVIDYGHEVNLVMAVRFKGGVIKHFYSDDIRVVGNPMNGEGWDTDIPSDWHPEHVEGFAVSDKVAKNFFIRNTKKVKE